MDNKETYPASIKYHLPTENKELLKVISDTSGVSVSEILRRLTAYYLNLTPAQASKLITK